MNRLPDVWKPINNQIESCRRAAANVLNVGLTKNAVSLMKYGMRQGTKSFGHQALSLQGFCAPCVFPRGRQRRLWRRVRRLLEARFRPRAQPLCASVVAQAALSKPDQNQLNR